MLYFRVATRLLLLARLRENCLPHGGNCLRPRPLARIYPLATANMHVYRISSSSYNDFLLEILGIAIIFSAFPLCYPFTSVYAFVPRGSPKAKAKANHRYRILFFFQQTRLLLFCQRILDSHQLSYLSTSLPRKGAVEVEDLVGGETLEREEGREAKRKKGEKRPILVNQGGSKSTREFYYSHGLAV